MKIPFKLYYLGEFMGEVVSHSYETPWSYGDIIASDEEEFLKLVSAQEYSDYMFDLESLNISEEREDELCELKYKELGVEEKYYKMLISDSWKLVDCTGATREIYGLKFYRKGYIQWRG